jgi:hypothetical protein
MPNQWETAANSDNPYDGSGYMYSLAIDSPVSNFFEQLYPASDFSMATFWNNFPYETLDALRYDYPNFFREAIYSSAVQLSTEAKDKVVALINILVDSSSITDFQIIKDLITGWEDEVQSNSNQFSSDELAKLLAASSVARYATYILLRREICCPGNNSNQARGNFWSWVGAVVLSQDII